MVAVAALLPLPPHVCDTAGSAATTAAPWRRRCEGSGGGGGGGVGGMKKRTMSESFLPREFSATCLRALGALRGDMPKTRSSTCLSKGLRLNYDTFGDPAKPAVLLIMGLAAQKVRYPDSFCRRVADSGYYVVRFDNRDCGSSGRHFERTFERVSCLVGLPLMALRNALKERWKYLLVIYLLLGHLAWTRRRRRYRLAHALAGFLTGLGVALSRSLCGPYSCEDMALDCVQLLEHLGVVRAHIVGFSMGGMIAQAFAREHPRRVLSLVLLSTCHPNSPMATANLPFMAMHAITTGGAFLPIAEAATRQKALERFWKNLSAHETFDTPAQRKLALEEVSRGAMDIDAYLRQVMAVLRFTDGTLRRPEQKAGAPLPPTLVIHGADDPLIPIQNGLELAKLMKCKNCVILPSFGHDILPGAEDEVYQAVMAHLSEVDSAAPAAGAPPKGSAEAGWAKIKKCPSIALLQLEKPRG
mmetsp:Transcript_15681/g.44766  ORF Transcript_15681/g.44766 Transcript_15681/m.44766 type:complete len:471 (-) Transcript_15681:62-1474(-)